MILKTLKLTNFRNHTAREFNFSSSVNLIIGPNAVGKTNVLEAIYLLASGRSFRVKGVEEEMIREGAEMARITGSVELEVRNGSGSESEKLEIVLTRGEVMGIKTAKKKYLVNDVGRRAGDFIGRLRTVCFGPEDLELVIGSPSVRRRWLDNVLSQTDQEYTRASLSYEKGLRARNRLLEEMRESGFSDKKRLFFWDQLLIKNGNYLTQKREEYLNFVNSEQLPVNSKILVEYDRSTISPERLAQYEKEEVASGTTLVGPHRDDFKIRMGDRNLAVYGSRGEQRLAILWLKLAELAFIEKKSGEKPLLLLDDIFSELDQKHRTEVLTLIQGQQVIITSADPEMISHLPVSPAQTITLG